MKEVEETFYYETAELQAEHDLKKACGRTKVIDGKETTRKGVVTEHFWVEKTVGG